LGLGLRSAVRWAVGTPGDKRIVRESFLVAPRDLRGPAEPHRHVGAPWGLSVRDGEATAGRHRSARHSRLWGFSMGEAVATHINDVRQTLRLALGRPVGQCGDAARRFLSTKTKPKTARERDAIDAAEIARHGKGQDPPCRAIPGPNTPSAPSPAGQWLRRSGRGLWPCGWWDAVSHTSSHRRVPARQHNDRQRARRPEAWVVRSHPSVSWGVGADKG